MRAAITFDRSARRFDADGRLHARCRISKANVCDYLTEEIPRWKELGLKPGRRYRVYRDSQELAKAAATFGNAPLLLDHVPVSADAPAQELIAGTVANAAFEYPYLTADVTVWTREAIDGIESGARKELSAAYAWTPIVEKGVTREGERYEIRMTAIRANHVALVAEGRAGPDVVVADGKSPRVSAADLWPALRDVRRT